MSELFKEIEDDIRQERFDKLWHSFGKIMIGVSLAVIVATIVIVVVQNRRQSNAMEHTAQFIKGIDRLNIEDYKGAIPVFSKLAEDPASSYYGLSMLRKAQAENALSKHDEAAKTYKELAQHDPVYGELAKLLAATDDAAPVEAVKTSPFYYSQSEWRGWQLLQHGKKDDAVAQFVALYQDPETPNTIRSRMTEVLGHVAPDKVPHKTDDLVSMKGETNE